MKIRPAPHVLVTGGARRIGRAIVEDLAAHGFAVAIHCNARDEAEALAEQLTGTGAGAVVQADLTDREAVDGLIEAASGALGADSAAGQQCSVCSRTTA